MAIIDTNVVIEYLRGTASIASVIDAYMEKEGVSITAISRYELLQRFYRDQSLLSFLSEVETYPLDRKASDKAAELWHKLRADGNAIDDIDLLIAGVAISKGETFITMDSDFKNIKGDIKIIRK